MKVDVSSKNVARPISWRRPRCRLLHIQWWPFSSGARVLGRLRCSELSHIEEAVAATATAAAAAERAARVLSAWNESKWPLATELVDRGDETGGKSSDTMLKRERKRLRRKMWSRWEPTRSS